VKGQSGTAPDMAHPPKVSGTSLANVYPSCSKDCNQLLSVPPVIGREFGIETLRT